MKLDFYFRFGGDYTNKLYHWELYDKRKLDMNRKAVTRNNAWITSGEVIAENIDQAKEKLGNSFDLNSGKYILNFDLGEKYIAPHYVQDDGNPDVFIEEFLLED